MGSWTVLSDSACETSLSLTDRELQADIAVEPMIISCGDCCVKDKETRGRKSITTTGLVIMNMEDGILGPVDQMTTVVGSVHLSRGNE